MTSFYGINPVHLVGGLLIIAALISITVAAVEAWVQHRRDKQAARNRYETQLEQWRAPGPGRHRGQQ